MASFSAMQFLFSPLLGWLSDRYGRRPVIVISLLGTAAGYVLFAFAHSLPMLFASRVLAGITGGNIGTAQAVIADVTSGPARARGMGLIGMAFGLGFILGPAIGGFTVKVDPAAPGLVAAGLSLTACLWAALRLPETRPAGMAARGLRLFPGVAFVQAVKRPGIAALLAVSFIATAAFSAFEATFAQFLSTFYHFSASHTAWAFVVVGFTSAAVQGGLLKRLVPRFGEGRLMLAGSIMVGAALFVLLWVPSVAVLFACIVVMAAGTGIMNPSLITLVSRRSHAHEQGEILGVLQAMSSLGRIVGPFGGENLLLRTGPAGAYGTAGIMYAVTTVIIAAGVGTGIHSAEAPRAGVTSPAAEKPPQEEE
jgi:MFS family permease